ncbi:hypothetical protein Gpo141_00008747 [Globisporangium polare]
MRTANEAPKEQQQQQPETVDTSLLSGDMSEQEQAKSSLEKQQGHEGLHPHKESDEDEQSEGLDSVSHQHVEQQDEHDEEDEEADDDEDNSALKKAARAGIRLLEENAQLADEVRHLQLQLTHRNEHCLELQRVLEEKDAQMEQLTQHLRESIFENQSVLSELNKAKEQVARYKKLLTEQEQRQNHRSPGKRIARNVSPQRNAQLQQQLTVLVLDDEGVLSSQSGSSDETQKTTADTPVVGSGKHHTTSNGNGRSRSSSPVGPISPKRRQAARLEEVEAKFEEAHRRNSILKMELTSAQKKVTELKPLNAQLHEVKEENQVLRHEIEKLEKQMDLSLEERAEESALIQSLRTTIEIYQSLDDPSRSAKQHQQFGFRKSTLFAEADDDDQARRLSKMRRRRSDGCIIPLSSSASTAATAVKQPPICWTNAVDDCFSTRDETEVVLESLDGLVDQLLSLQQQQEGKTALHPDTSRAKDDTTVVTVATWPRTRFLEQQVMVLQDLLRRYRAQWRQSAEKRSSIEIENGNLLSRIEALNVLVQRQCELCTRASEKQTQENETWKAAASAYETLLQQVTGAQDAESEAEVEHMCFSILRRLVDTWTVDKSKRMKLHDWLTNAIRSTGKRKPLYLPDLSDEIALGFQTLLVPILRHKFGVDVHIEKRLRNVVVTDLKLHVGSTDVEMAKACLQRISRSLMWLMDVESTQMHESEWLGEVSRKKAARVYQGK